MASPASNASRTAETAGSATGATGKGVTSRPAVDVTAMTTRDDFLLELGESLSGQASVHPVDSMGAALEYLTNANRGQVLVIDTRDIQDVRADVDRAHAQAPHAVVLVFAVAEAEKQVGAAVKGSNVFAVLPIPLDKRKSGAVLEGAVADALARKAARVTERSTAVSVEPFQPQADAGGSSDSDAKSKMSLWVGAGIAALAMIAVGAFLFLGGKHGPTAPPAAARKTPAAHLAQPAANPGVDDATLAPRPEVETALVQGKVDDLLEKARLAMRERRYSEPAGDNALLYYRSAAAADASNAEALDGLQRVAGVLASRFDGAMSDARYDEAGVALANFKAAAPKDARIGALELRLTTAQVSKALADGSVDRAAALVRVAQQSGGVPADQIGKWRAEIARRQEDVKVQRLASLVSDRIRDGRLIDPSDDSAKAYLQQLHDQAATSSTTQRLTRELNTAYLRKAREAAVGNHAPEADRWLAEAKAGGVSANDLTSFQRDLVTVRQKAVAAESDRLVQLARERLRDGRLTDPAQDSAAYFVGQLQGTDAANGALAQVTRDLAGKLIERARASAQNGKSALVDTDLTLAKRFGADSKDILAVQQIQSSLKSASAGGSRSAATANIAALAASLKRVRYVAPEYPSKALAQSVAGAVIVEYTVDVNGNPRDPRVVEATPPGVFDRAAISAIKRWRYAPAVVDGTPVEVPIRASIRFELPK
ncbi:MAG: TonB family protein [Steroidobacteraceae bacterium]